MYLLRLSPSYKAQTLCLLTPRRNLSKGWVAWNWLVLTLVLLHHHCHTKHHWLLMFAIRYQIREVSNRRTNLQVTGSLASVSVSFAKQFGHGQPLERNIKKFNYAYWFWASILPSRPGKRCILHNHRSRPGTNMRPTEAQELDCFYPSGSFPAYPALIPTM